MIRNLRAAFGLGLVTAMTLGALNVVGASATTSGHFVSSSASGISRLEIQEGTDGLHKLELAAIGTTVACHATHFAAPNLTSTTATAITVSAEYTSCTSGGNAASVTMSECYFEATSPPVSGHGTVHLRCPSGAKVQVHTSAGTISFGEQTPTKGGVAYTTSEVGNLHALTVDVTAEGIHYECHGACLIFGTKGTTAALKGSLTVQSREVGDPIVGLTAT
jgi:hypothetical protein